MRNTSNAGSIPAQALMIDKTTEIHFEPLEYGTKAQWNYVKFIEYWAGTKYEGMTYRALCNFIETYKDVAWENCKELEEIILDNNGEIW